MNSILSARRGRGAFGRGLFCCGVVLLAMALGPQLAAPSVALAADPPVNLGVAASYAVLAGSTITNTGPSVISGVLGGDIGVAPGSSITGFPPGSVSGTIHSGDASATAAQTALTAAYLDAAGRPTTRDLTGLDLGGLRLTPGVYEFSSSAQLTGELILDGQGNPEALFVFKIGTTLTTASNSTVTLINGARFCRVFWQVDTATLGTGTDFVGHILALTSITANTGANVEGQLLARNGAVTLDTNNITNGLCEDAATLHVIKNVVNDDGGTAVASDFPVHVRLGALDVYGSPQPGAESPGTTYTVLAGTYSVSEDASSAYSSSYNGDSDADGNITLLAGQVATVTITNNDIDTTGSVDITKRVRNLSGTTLRTGSVLLWTIVVTNDGEIPLTNVVVTDRISGYTTYVKGITGPGRDSRNVPSLVWRVGTLAPGESVTLSFKSAVKGSVPNGTRIFNRAWVNSDQTAAASAAVRTTAVRDTPTLVARTSGDEGITLGFMGLLAVLALGFAWSGRSGASPGLRRGMRVTASTLLSAMLLLGFMEVGATYGLPLASPGEEIASAARTVAARTGVSTVRSTTSSRVTGRVSIPAIGVNVGLVEGASMNALNQGVWRQPPSAKPGSAGASVIAGHRTSGQFRRLSKLKVGNRVRVTTGGRTYVYRVASVTTRNASGKQLSFRTGVKQKLILYTCVRWWQGDKRVVVVCYRVKK